jgi:hypothetical protein
MFFFDRIRYIKIYSLIYKTIVFLSRMRLLLLIIKCQDLDTGEIKTLNYVNGIVLWSDDEAGSIAFAVNSLLKQISIFMIENKLTLQICSQPLFSFIIINIHAYH